MPLQNKSIFFQLFLTVLVFLPSGNANHVRELNEDSWRDLLEGEWMVEFYAPWCPACNALQPVWRELSIMSKAQSLGLNVGAVDVTVSPVLSGRFMVTALPTIYHVKDGIFRLYKGPREVESITEWCKEEKWKAISPISSWSAPDSFQMSLVGSFFKFSQTLRGVHTMLMESYGLPTWGSYLIFAIATIFVGAMLGLVLVCVIDFLYPVKKPDYTVAFTQQELDRMREKNPQLVNEALINDDIVDEESQTDGEDPEKYSGTDSQESESEDTKNENLEGGDVLAQNADKQDIRKRRSRKAD